MAAALVGAAPAQSADKLSGAEIRALLTGSKAQGTTDGFDDVTVVFAPDGTVTGRAQALLFVEEDTGTWEVDGDTLCLRWRSWADAERTCLVVERRDGGYESYTSDGALRTVFQVEKTRQLGATGGQELLDLYPAEPAEEAVR